MYSENTVTAIGRLDSFLRLRQKTIHEALLRLEDAEGLEGVSEAINALDEERRLNEKLMQAISSTRCDYCRLDPDRRLCDFCPR